MKVKGPFRATSRSPHFSQQHLPLSSLLVLGASCLLKISKSARHGSKSSAVCAPRLCLDQDQKANRAVSNSTNLGIILFMMQASKKIPFEDPNVVMGVRGAYLLSNLLIIGIYLYIQSKINAKRGEMKPPLLNLS